jgi:hypothetical protein
MKRLSLLFLCFLGLSPLSLHAQLGLYGGFTVKNLGVPENSGDVFYGGTLGAYLARGELGLFNVGVDLRASSVRDGGASFTDGAIGPRVALNLHIVPLHPYVEGMVGAGSLQFGGGSPNNGINFEYQVLGGVDFTILPRLDWRVFEFGYGGLSVPEGGPFHPKSLTTALVLRLPRVFPLP